MAYGPRIVDLSRRVAIYVDKILKGAKPGDLPDRAAHQVRAGHQPQDRQGPRPDDPAVAAGAGGSGDRVMDRRRFLLTSLAGALAAPLAAEAQQAGKVYRIGFLSGSSRAASKPAVEEFRQGLRELGYVEGQNIDHRIPVGGGPTEPPSRSSPLTSLRHPSDLIVAVDLPVRSGCSQRDHVHPYRHGQRAVIRSRLGLPRASADPARIVTGDLLGPELAAKHLELLRKSSRESAHSGPDQPGQSAGFSGVKETEAAARTLAYSFSRLSIAGPDDVATAFRDATKGARRGDPRRRRPSGQPAWRQISALALSNRLPTMFRDRRLRGCGRADGISADILASYRRAATYVDKILKGAKPGDLPIEEPTTFELVINLKTAKALGLTIPPSLLARADQVIQ